MSTLASPVTSFSAGTLPRRSWSVVAWAAIAACSVLLTYTVTLVLGLCLIGLGCLLTIGMFSKGPSFLGLVLDAFAVIVGTTILWSLFPRKDSFTPDGILMDLSRQPRLREELEAIARIMREPLPSEVYLVSAANAAVAQRDGKFGFGNRRLMLLGLPLLQTLSVSQFRAVLAHEFAHFYSGDTSIGPWVFKARSNMARGAYQPGSRLRSAFIPNTVGCRRYPPRGDYRRLDFVLEVV